MQEQNNAKKSPYNVHDLEFEVEEGDKSSSGDCYFYPKNHRFSETFRGYRNVKLH